MKKKIGSYPCAIFSDGEIELEVYDSEDDITHYVYLKKSELEEMLECMEVTK